MMKSDEKPNDTKEECCDDLLLKGQDGRVAGVSTGKHGLKFGKEQEWPRLVLIDSERT